MDPIDESSKGHDISTLIGTLISPSFHLFSPSGTETVYFIFSDLSVRKEGSFRLKFSLFNLAGPIVDQMPQLTTVRGKILDEAFSDVFEVVSPQEFHGMMESTELTKSLAFQGIKLPIRNSHGSRARGEDD